MSSSLFLIKPVNFGYNYQTAVDNVFQQIPAISCEEIQKRALTEFCDYIDILRSKNIEVIVFEDSKDPQTPDSIFPNDWVSFHEDGLYILYPMFATNRRQERRADIIEALESKYGYKITQRYDISSYEDENKFLEGAGVLVFDYFNKIVYCSISNRAHQTLVKKVAKFLNYQYITFKAKDEKNRDIYHTTVVMAVGEKYAIVCEDAIKDIDEKKKLRASLENTNHEIITISLEQMYSYAANVLEVVNTENKKFLIMSETAYEILTKDQKNTIMKYATILAIPLKTIELYGGGSARCMLGDIRLKKQ